MAKPQFAALNTDFVLALTAGACEQAIDVLGQLGFHFLVSPVVEESLFWISVNGRYDESKQCAASAHPRLASLGIITPGLDGMDRFYTRDFATKCLETNLCGQGCYLNDYLAVAEASRLQATVLLTARPVLHCQDKLNLALINASLDPVRIVDMMQYF